MIINASYPIGGGYQVIRSWPDAANVASVSLDVSGIDWEKWMDVFLEADIVKQSGSVSLRLDGVSTSGKYYYQSGNAGVMGFFLGSVPENWDTTPFRLTLRVIKEKNTEFYVAAVCLREPFYNSVDGVVNVETSPDASYGGRTKGHWCKMQTLNFAVDRDTLSWSNIRLIGMKRP